jgi:hypothetical protein
MYEACVRFAKPRTVMSRSIRRRNSVIVCLQHVQADVKEAACARSQSAGDQPSSERCETGRDRRGPKFVSYRRPAI